jgi:DNA repair exonuclease SbcCD ATPase subunit
MTKELMLNTEAIIDMEKEIKKELEDELVEAKTKIQKLEQELKKLQTEDPQYQQLKENIEKKKIELAELKNVIIKNNELEEDDLEDILEDQINFLKTGDSRRLDRTKRKLVKSISNQEITNLCQLQESIIKLEIKLGETQVNQINQIINNNNYYYSLGSVSAQGGNVLVGNNTFTGDADFSVQNLEAKVEQKNTKLF